MNTHLVRNPLLPANRWAFLAALLACAIGRLVRSWPVGLVHPPHYPRPNASTTSFRASLANGEHRPACM
jgi:hypothetical protein